MMFAVISLISAIAKGRREYEKADMRAAAQAQGQPMSALTAEQLLQICGGDDGVPGPHGTWGLPPVEI